MPLPTSRPRPGGRTLVLLALLAGAAALLAAQHYPSTSAQAQLAVALPAPVEAVPAAPMISRETITVRNGDTLARLLNARGQTSQVVHELMAAGSATRLLASIRTGNSIDIGVDEDGRLLELDYSPDPLRTLSIRRAADGSFSAELVEKETVTVSRYAEGVIEDSLFASGKRAGVSDGVILRMADIFGYDIDFALEVQRGDTFRILYEEVLVEGRRIRDGEVLTAEFVNQGKTHRAVRYQPQGGTASYYTPEGNAMRKAFLRSPVEFARISSRFNLQRRHPVLHTIRAHKGVDYAAPRGTPVRATANGRVEFAGNKGGYGRTIVLQHNNSQTTLYAHLDRFAPNIRSGARVSQGQLIGYVGTTGLSTGPHLHYEFRVGGVHVDPLRMKSTPAEPIAAAEKQAFLAEATRMLAMMDGMSGQTAVAARSTPANANSF